MDEIYNLSRYIDASVSQRMRLDIYYPTLVHVQKLGPGAKRLDALPICNFLIGGLTTPNVFKIGVKVVVIWNEARYGKQDGTKPIFLEEWKGYGPKASGGVVKGQGNGPLTDSRPSLQRCHKLSCIQGGVAVFGQITQLLLETCRFNRMKNKDRDFAFRIFTGCSERTRQSTGECSSNVRAIFLPGRPYLSSGRIEHDHRPVH